MCVWPTLYGCNGHIMTRTAHGGDIALWYTVSYICSSWLTHVVRDCHTYMTLWSAHGGDQTWNIWISRFNSFPVHSFEWRGLLFTSVKICLICWGLPWKHVWTLRGPPWKLVWKFCSREYFKSDFVRPWMHYCVMCFIWLNDDILQIAREGDASRTKVMRHAHVEMMRHVRVTCPLCVQHDASC